MATELEILRKGKCPDCGAPISRFFVTERQPWCVACDHYFEIWDGGQVCRTKDAQKLYDKYWKELGEEPFDEWGRGMTW